MLSNKISPRFKLGCDFMTQIAIACDSYNFILINLLTAAAANRHRLYGV